VEFDRTPSEYLDPMLNAKPQTASEFDFNSDGRADFIDRVTGQANVFLQTASGGFQSRALAAPAPEVGWELVSSGDFDQDGQMDDLFWRNRRSNKTAIALVDAGTITTTNFLSAQAATFFPKFADFNGDGTTDIFWQHTGEQASEIWFIKAGKIAESLPLPRMANGWNAEIADFNADGKTDLLWSNASTGQLSAWLLDGTKILAQSPIELPGSGSERTLLDFNGDGRTDIFTRERFTGRSRVWLWDDSGLKPQPTPIDLPTTSPDGTFSFGDFNGDRRSDILFRAPVSDRATLFLGQTTGGFETEILKGLGNQYIDRVQDFDSDGKTDLLLTNIFTTTSQLLLLDGAQVLQTKPSGRNVEPIVLPIIAPLPISPAPSAPVLPPTLTIDPIIPIAIEPIVVPPIIIDQSLQLTISNNI
jgi:FG-GAP-like repeat